MDFKYFLVFFIFLIFISGCINPNNLDDIRKSNNPISELIVSLSIKECNERAGKNLTDGIYCAEEIGPKINDILECENLNYEWSAPWSSFSGPGGPMLHARVPCMESFIEYKKDESACLKLDEKTSFSAQDRENCIRTAARIKLDENACSYITDDNNDKFSFNWCVNGVKFERAKLKNDLKFCDGMVGADDKEIEESRDGCIIQIAELRKNESVCNELSASSILRDNCFNIVGQSKKDEKICELAISSYYKDLCFVNIAIETNNESLCLKTNSTEERSFCLYLIALDKNDIDICQMAESPNKEYCIETINEKVENVSKN